ncbi:MAG: aldo/keto reductase [Chloroflexota bacterium]
MKYKTMPNGIQIPAIGLGTWEIGGGRVPDYSQDAQLVKRLSEIINMGYTHIDTAEMYASGHTEELIGRAIHDFERNDLFITTKVWRTNLGYNAVHKALTSSLERLQTDYVDLYLIHWPDQATPLSETFRALNELVSDGRVRCVGVSNFNVALLEEAIQLCQTPLATNQVRYNLNHREHVTNGVLDFCQRHEILLTAYSPLKDGVLHNDVVREMARKYNATSGQIGLAWLVQQPHVITIPKSTNMKHLQDNLDSLSLNLDESDMEMLNKLS